MCICATCDRATASWVGAALDWDMLVNSAAPARAEHTSTEAGWGCRISPGLDALPVHARPERLRNGVSIS